MMVVGGGGDGDNNIENSIWHVLKTYSILST